MAIEPPKTFIAIGLGKQMLKHSEALKALGYECIYAVDPDPDARRRFEDHCTVPPVPSVDEVGTQYFASVGMVILTTPVSGRIELIEHILRLGVRLIVTEKPLCLTLQEAKRCFQLASEWNADIFVNYTYRLASPFFELLLASSNSLSEIDYCNMHLGGRGNHQPWKHQQPYGGALNEMGVHLLDLLMKAFGGPDGPLLAAQKLVRRTRLIHGQEVDCNAEDLSIFSGKFGSVECVAVADMLCPEFANRVLVASPNRQYVLSIGGVAPESLGDTSPPPDYVGLSAYQRLYKAIFDPAMEGMLHTPKDTVSLQLALIDMEREAS